MAPPKVTIWFFATLALSLLDTAFGTLINANASIETAKRVLENDQFDRKVVVGGGTAGMAVARRISENPNKKVLVIEAGRSGVNDTVITIPKNSFAFIGSEIDWFYSTTPQTNAAGQEINTSQGKVLGGDSAVNGLQWTTPHEKDMRAMEKVGGHFFEWDKFYNAILRAENLNIPPREFAEEFGYNADPASHGNGGPVDTAFPKFIPEQHLRLINATVELGHPFNPDPYRGDNLGVWFSLSSQTEQCTRETSEFAYFNPVLDRKNLIVIYNALATKLEVPENKHKQSVESTGVRVRLPDGSVEVASITDNGEVLLAAGTMKTPQLLELSGIGNRKVLEKFDIPVKLHLPGVGENYEDHTLTILTFQLKEGFLSFDALGYNETLLEEQTELYNTKRDGWFCFANGAIAMLSANDVLTPEDRKIATKILKRKPSSTPLDQFEALKENFEDGVPQVEILMFNSFSGGPEKLPNTSYVSLAVTHLHPFSRGSIHINSTSIDDHPLIDPNVLEAEFDKWFLAKATAYARKYSNTTALGEIFKAEVFPGSNVQTDEDWRVFVSNTTNVGYHAVGTASMLPQSKNGVVGTDLRVYGTSNIRVVDNSIIPLLISGHIQTLAYGVAELAAGIIKSTW